MFIVAFIFFKKMFSPTDILFCLDIQSFCTILSHQLMSSVRSGLLNQKQWKRLMDDIVKILKAELYQPLLFVFLLRMQDPVALTPLQREYF